MGNIKDSALFNYGLKEWATEPMAAFDAFLANFQFKGRHLRPSSFVIYRGMFQRLLRWAQEQAPPRKVVELNDTALELFLEERSLAAETRHRYLLVFNTLFEHLAQLQIALSETPAPAADNPARTLLMDGPAPDRADPEYLTLQEMEAFLKALPSATTWKKARTNALAYTLVGAGLRSSEALGLTLADLPLKNGILERVWVQAHKPRPLRQVPLQPFAREPLQNWLTQRASLGIPGQLVFPSNTAGAALQPVTLFRLIKSTLESAGISKRYEGSTLLRNTCGVLWLARHDSERVMLWMGHATLRTTELLLAPEKRTKETAESTTVGQALQAAIPLASPPPQA